MIDFLHTFHAHNRFLMLAFALACCIKLLMNIFGKKDFSKGDATLLRFYAIVFTIQFAVGLVLFVNMGSMSGWDMSMMRLQFEHATIMIIALGLSHATAGVKRKDPAVRSSRALIFVGLSLLLILVGVGRLKGFGYWMGL